MLTRTIDNVLHELCDEENPPMVRFVSELSRCDWAQTMVYDLSMLRLWIARPGSASVEIMVTYEDGRKGGRPAAPYVDVYEITEFSGAQRVRVSVHNLTDSLDWLSRWATSLKPVASQ